MSQLSDTEEQISREEQISSEETEETEETEEDVESDSPVKPPKKKRVLSEERKAALREQLARVRSKRFEANKPVRQLKEKITKLKKITERERREASALALKELDGLRLGTDRETEREPEIAVPIAVESEYERRFRLARSQIFPSFS